MADPMILLDRYNVSDLEAGHDGETGHPNTTKSIVK